MCSPDCVCSQMALSDTRIIDSRASTQCGTARASPLGLGSSEVIGPVALLMDLCRHGTAHAAEDGDVRGPGGMHALCGALRPPAHSCRRSADILSSDRSVHTQRQSVSVGKQHQCLHILPTLLRAQMQQEGSALQTDFGNAGNSSSGRGHPCTRHACELQHRHRATHLLLQIERHPFEGSDCDLHL